MPEKSESLPTQNFVDIEAIRNGTIVLKSGGLRQVLVVSGVNFDLKSEEEQGMILSLFQNFFNTLNFSIQIFIHSRKVNIDAYLERLSEREAKEPNELLKNQIAEYREFIHAFVAENAIMAKSYFIVVPYDPVKLPQGSAALTDKILVFLKKKGIEKPTPRLGGEGNADEELTTHIGQLSQRVNQVITALNQMDLRAVALNDEELMELFYNLYNPEAIEKRGVALPQEKS